jgi:polysaccharide pyruvyl transferase WcaK-like protein
VRVGIAGWFGSDNLGDELLLATTLRLLGASQGTHTATVFGADAGRVSELHGVRAVPLAPAGYLAKARGVRELCRELARIDVLLVGPGTVLQERSPNLRWPGTLPMFLRLCVAARLVGTPVIVFGAGVREDTSACGRAALRMIGRSSAAVGVRDPISARLLGPGARVIGDVAAAWLPPAAVAMDPCRFAISLRPLSPKIAGPVWAAVSDVVAALQADGLRGDFLIVASGVGSVGENDHDVWSSRFRSTLTPVVIPLSRAVRPGDTWTGGLACYRVVVAARLHAAVVALHFATPTVAIAYEEKVFRTFTALGLRQFVWVPTMPVRDLLRMTRHALADPTPFLAARELLAGDGVRVRQFLESSLAEVAS